MRYFIQQIYIIQMNSLNSSKQFFEFIRNDYLSYITMFLSNICWVSGYIYANQNKMSPIQTLLSRGILNYIFNLFFCRYFSQPLDFKDPSNMKTLMIRHLVFSLHGFTIAWVQFYLPLPITHTIGTIGPVLVVVLDFLINHSKISPRQIFGIIGAFLGIILTANGELIYQYWYSEYQFTSDFRNYKSQSGLVMLGICIVFILVQFLWAYSVLITKNSNSSPFQIGFHLSICLVFTSSISTNLIQQNKVESIVFYYSLIFVGIFLALSEFLFSFSLQVTTNMGGTMVWQFSSVLIGYGYSMIRYHEKINIVVLVGVLFVLIGIFLVSIRKNNIQ